MIVQKFGGTSLGRQGGFKRIVEIVKQVSIESNLIVVVSALSNVKKTEGVTSKLMQASQLAVKGKSGFLKIIQEIEKLHIKLVESNIKNEANKKAITEEIKEILKKTRNFLEATKIIGELTTRSIDNIISVGERLSAKIFALKILRENSIPATTFDLSELIKKDWVEISPKLFQNFKKT